MWDQVSDAGLDFRPALFLCEARDIYHAGQLLALLISFPLASLDRDLVDNIGQGYPQFISFQFNQVILRCVGSWNS